MSIAPPTPKRFILYCRDCKWAADATNSGVANRCPRCDHMGLSYVAYREHEKAQADDVLVREIGRTVDGVKPYEET